MRGRRRLRRITELRLASLERQMFHLEDWTGCHTDEDLPDEEEPTVKETLAAQDRIIKHLLVTLDVLVPGFSIEAFREALPLIDDALTERDDVEVEPGDRERLLSIMEGLIPDPLPRENTARKPTGRNRLTLVPKAPDGNDND